MGRASEVRSRSDNIICQESALVSEDPLILKMHVPRTGLRV
jgi:hypothetical protein